MISDIDAPLHMIADQPMDGVRAEDAGSVDCIRCQRVHQQWSQWPAEPIVCRDIEPGLLPVEHRFGKLPAHQFLQNVLLMMVKTVNKISYKSPLMILIKEKLIFNSTSSLKKSRNIQYAILKYSPQIKSDSVIRLYFATAYNKFGENEIWKQERVRQFFGKDELLIGRDFWNFICDSNDGNRMVLEAYKQNAHFLKAALEGIIQTARQNMRSSNPSLWKDDTM